MSQWELPPSALDATADAVRLSTSEVLVRHEEADDVTRVAAVHVAAWQAGYAGILPDDFLSTLDVDAWAARRLEQLRDRPPGVATLVADVNGVITGFVTFGPDPDEVQADRVWACYVAPEWWGTGVADVILTSALATLPTRDVRLWVLEANHRARRFYERHGFRPDGHRDMYRPNTFAAPVPQLRYWLAR